MATMYRGIGYGCPRKTWLKKYNSHEKYVRKYKNRHKKVYVRLTWCVVVRFGGNRLCCVTRPHPEALYTETGEFRVMDHITCRIIASELEAAVCVERSVAGVRVIQSIQNFNTLNVILF